MYYNNLLHIRDAERYPMTKIDKIQNVLQKYGFQQEILVYRLHKHFDINADQKVVWTFSKLKSTSQVLKGQDYSPCVFMFDSQGELQPTQFYIGKNVWQEIKLRQNFDKLQQQLSKIIKGEQHVYGLILKLTGYKFQLQMTNQSNRTQQIFPIQDLIHVENDQSISSTKFQNGKKVYGVCCGLGCG